MSLDTCVEISSGRWIKVTSSKSEHISFTFESFEETKILDMLLSAIACSIVYTISGLSF